MKLLVTGFGPFGSVTDNPSFALASASGAPSRLVDVAYSAADLLIGELRGLKPGVLVCLGVHGSATSMRYELFGTNRTGKSPGVDGEVRAGPIWRGGPLRLGSTLFGSDETLELPREGMVLSADAGDYLCNYILFTALWKLPAWRVGFVHVPAFESMRQTDQALILENLLQRFR